MGVCFAENVFSGMGFTDVGLVVMCKCLIHLSPRPLCGLGIASRFPVPCNSDRLCPTVRQEEEEDLPLAQWKKIAVID